MRTPLASEARRRETRRHLTAIAARLGFFSVKVPENSPLTIWSEERILIFLFFSESTADDDAKSFNS